MNTLKLLKLKAEGRLQAGDRVQCSRLGVCTVVSIHALGTITVKNTENKYFRISGLAISESAKMVKNSSQQELTPA